MGKRGKRDLEACAKSLNSLCSTGHVINNTLRFLASPHLRAGQAARERGERGEEKGGDGEGEKKRE